MQKALTELNRKEKAEIISLNGGRTMQHRLEKMGIRKHQIISRINSQFMRGPVVISMNGHQTAIGRGMASRILVRPLNSGIPK